MNKHWIAMSTLATATILAIGCGAAPEGTPGPSDNGQTEGELTDTIIRPNPDGTPNVTVRKVTKEFRAIEGQYKDKKKVVEMQRAMLEQQAAKAAESTGGTASQSQPSIDMSCNSTSLWLYDTSYGWFGANRICVTEVNNYDNGTTWLPSNWQNAVRSFWTGSEWGALKDGFNMNCNNIYPFDEGDVQYPVLDATGQAADGVFIGFYCEN